MDGLWHCADAISRRVKMKSLVQVQSISISQRLAIGLVSLFFGMTLIYGVGLAQDERLHNAAHDTRHSIGFPCH
jgi:cobalt transporter subunit CbtB